MDVLMNQSFWNTTEATSKLDQDALQRIMLMSAFTVVAFCGNTCLLVYLVRLRAWTRPVSAFVMALAINDVLIAIFSMSGEILWEAFQEWIFGAVACKLATYIQCFLFMSTAFILMGMSLDRYRAICRPLDFSRTTTQGRRAIIAAWLTGLILAIPQLIIFVQVEVGEHPDKSVVYACKSAGYSAEWQRRAYVTWSTLCIFVIPVCFIAFCYTRIAVLLWRRSHTCQNEYTENPSHETTTCNLRTGNLHRKRSERAKLRTINLSVRILVCYVLCWAPYFTLNLLNVWTDYKYRNDIPSIIKTFAKSLAWFSSCINPFVYGGFMLPNTTGKVCWKKRPRAPSASHLTARSAHKEIRLSGKQAQKYEEVRESTWANL